MAQISPPPPPHNYPPMSSASPSAQTMNSVSPVPPVPSGQAMDNVSCGRTCLWLSAGGVGCFGLIIALIVGLALLTGNAVGGIFSGLGNAAGGFVSDVGRLFSGMPSARVITLPDVEALELLSELTTVRFNYARVVSSTSDMPPLLQGIYGNSLVMIAVGSIEAGLDFGAMRPEDFRYDEASNVLNLTLPPPRLQRCYFNEQESEIVERSSGVFAPNQPNLDNDSRRFALRQFRDMALAGIGNGGEEQRTILAEAQIEAAKVLSNFIALFNQGDQVPQIQISFKPIDPNTPLPDTCQ
jgi:hypothetical protein